MKRKFLSAFLLLATVWTLFGSLNAAAAEQSAAASETAPVVRFYGHQRSVAASDTYGIRLIALVNDLTPEEVGFDIALIKNDGTMGTYTKKVTTVYTSVEAQVDGKTTTITAEQLGGNYIYTLNISDVPADIGFIGYLCSAYYIRDGVKVSSETNQVIYYNAELWEPSYTLKQVRATYASHGITGSDFGFYGTDRNESEVAYMWDGVVDSKYAHCYAWDASNGTAYCTASLEAATVIARIRLAVVDRHDRNIGTQIQASVDGENWDTLYTISESDGDFVVLKAGTQKILEFDVESQKEYRYVRVKDTKYGGYSFSEILVYTKAVMPVLKTVDTVYAEYSVGTAGDGQYGFYGTDRQDTDMQYMWDNVVDNRYGYLMTWGSASSGGYNTGSYCSASLPSPTVIRQVQVSACANRHDKNKGVQIQASVDGKTWVTLYTISEADGDFVKAENQEKHLTFTVEDSTAYNYIRVYDSATGGFSFSEITVYAKDEILNYSNDFETLLNTKLPLSE